jgi:hypothetical protein
MLSGLSKSLCFLWVTTFPRCLTCHVLALIVARSKTRLNGAEQNQDIYNQPVEDESVIVATGVEGEDSE